MVATRRTTRLQHRKLPTQSVPAEPDSPCALAAVVTFDTPSQPRTPSPSRTLSPQTPHCDDADLSPILPEEPTPARPKRALYDCSSSSEDSESDNEMLETDNENVSVAEDLPNLRCIKGIQNYYGGRLHYQPCAIFRTSHDMLDYFVGLGTKDLQAEANKEWRKIKQTQQQSIREDIPGLDCGCCKRIPRADKGRIRGINARTKLKARNNQRASRSQSVGRLNHTLFVLLQDPNKGCQFQYHLQYLWDHFLPLLLLHL